MAKQPLTIKVAHKHQLIHLLGDLSLISVQRKDTLTSARIGL